MASATTGQVHSKLQDELSETVSSLSVAARLIEEGTFELADKVPSTVVGDLIAVTVELERLLDLIKETAEITDE
ncbi:hypothetical protein Z946_805 [Sulfitobacter noctilucicola]|uniref:Uncharacterized protein n=1 Tax=Sulfitobacter noctilucicola TaxID=1342301 RepID=A0A7W6Q5A2_9RHOB|nr:hypothetical protein [Sulfitobacter noctilucicola]KIN61949.1 hypothetical protein Z946_805 [Sulfitobacter noctilucicola]MBB4173530.1 hypothetical protein [Sulfitobacter noctilucicola]